MLYFTAQEPVVVLPLGASRIFLPGTTLELTEYLSRQIDAWRELQARQRPDIASSLIIKNQTIKIELALKYVENQELAAGRNLKKDFSAAIRNYFLDPNHVWVDADGEFSGSYIETLFRDANEHELRRLRSSMINQRSKILQERGYPTRGAKQNSGTFTEAEKEKIASEIHAEFEEMSKRLSENLKRTSLSELHSAIRQLNSDDGEIVQRSKVVREEIEKLSVLAQKITLDIAKANEEQKFLEVEIGKFRENQNTALSELRDVAAAAKSNLESEFANLRTAAVGSSEEALRTIAKITNAVEQIQAQTSSELDAFKSKYEEKARLHLPTEYWAKKGAWHFGSAIAAFLVFVGAISGAGYMAFGHFGQIWSHLKDLQSHSAGSFVSVTGLAVVTIPAIAFFWILKHISRVFVENLAQSNDAGQRRVMMQTYLALVGDPTSKVSEQERLLVLNALFRPSASHGSDDAPPANLLDILKQIGDSDKKGK